MFHIFIPPPRRFGGPCALATEAGARAPRPACYCPPVTLGPHGMSHCDLFAPKHEGESDHEAH